MAIWERKKPGSMPGCYPLGYARILTDQHRDIKRIAWSLALIGIRIEISRKDDELGLYYSFWVWGPSGFGEQHIELFIYS